MRSAGVPAGTRHTGRRLALAVGLVAGLAGLAGCSHSCIPYGWYKARSAAPLKSPPGGPPLAHDPTYDIPGGAAVGKPTRDQACLVQPPNVLNAKAAASAAHPTSAATSGGPRR